MAIVPHRCLMCADPFVASSSRAKLFSKKDYGN
jgi:hypothetical protein